MKKPAKKLAADKIDLVCGVRKPEGYIGVDKVKLPGVNVVCDLDRFPWPFKDNTFSVIRAHHALQFLQHFVRVMEEIHRIGKPNAQVLIDVPYFMSSLAFGDPGHKRYFSEHAFLFFTEKSWYISHLDKLTKARFTIEKMEFRTTGKWRRLIPFRRLLRPFLWNIVDELSLEMMVIK